MPAARTLATQLRAMVATEPVANVTMRSVPLASERTSSGSFSRDAVTWWRSSACPMLVNCSTSPVPPR
eukprot:1216968-Prymnesium_polylepis.1